MRWTRWTAVALVAVAALCALLSLSCSTATTTQTAAPAAMTAEQKVARGAYIMGTYSCGDCHTPGSLYGAPDTTRRFSGSELGWVGPWGVVYAANLTPDSTGLAAWSEDQIVNVFKTGIRPDGRQLAPIMPWMALSHMTDDDLHAIVAYLKSLPPVKHVAPKPVPPTEKPKGAVVMFPPPPAWDAMNLPKPPGMK